MLHWKLLLARLQAMHVYIHFCTHFYYACLPTCPVQTRLCYRSLEIYTTSMYMHMSKHMPANMSFAHLYAHPSYKCVPYKCVHTHMSTCVPTRPLQMSQRMSASMPCTDGCIHVHSRLEYAMSRPHVYTTCLYAFLHTFLDIDTSTHVHMHSPYTGGSEGTCSAIIIQMKPSWAQWIRLGMYSHG